MTMPTRSPDDGGSAFSPPSDYSAAPALRQAARWPSVIGVISIILGSLGILCWGCNSGGSILSVVAPDTFEKNTTMTFESGAPAADAADAGEASAGSGNAGDTETGGTTAVTYDSPAEAAEGAEEAERSGQTVASVQMQPGAVHIVVELISLVFSIWLLVGGIKLLGRTPSAVGILKSWAVLRILLAIAWVGLMIMELDGIVYVVQQEMAIQARESGTAAPDISRETMRLIGLIVFIVAGVVQLVWPIFLLLFFSGRSVREDIESWRDPNQVIGGQV
ncbi:MAG: hypothetical protein MK116_01355 [Phycisphaerales bacterium]|nr:hypothetical protein [Phycisphaerales bacterium]